MPDQGIDSSPQDTPNNTGSSDRQADTGSLQHIRALAMPFIKGSMVTEPDGSLLIKDVPMLAEGVWTDSRVQTPLNYIARTLEADAKNWLDYSGWNRHLGNTPRASTDKVGEAIAPHYGRFLGNDGQMHNGILADVRVWPWTQNQRDMQEMIRHGLISFVSVEHGGDERLNPATRQMESASLIFTGFAFVNKGACKLCRLNEQPQPPIEPPQDSAPSEDTMETKELEAKIADLTKELEVVKAAQKPAEVKVEIPKELAELPGKIKELMDANAALTTKITKLEQDGTGKTTGGAPTKELEEPINRGIRIDRESGTIRRA